MRKLTNLIFFVFLAACGDKDRGTITFSDHTGDSAAPVDSDGDGYPERDDCDDNDDAVNPAAEEVCDGIDNNCDGRTDESSATDAESYYRDADGDGYGDPEDSIQSCESEDSDSLAGYVSQGDDCDDADANYHPGASESDCTDPNDYNCDGSVGYADADGDGHPACEDCDDADAAVNPGAEEICDEQDQDCDGDVDEGVTSTYYFDTDGDGFGDPDYSNEACDTPTGYADNNEDCDDNDANINPNAEEVCDDIDNNCDGEVDVDAVDATNWYADDDGDGYGDPTAAELSCEVLSGHVSDNTDCDDTNAYTYPGIAVYDSTADCMTDEDSDGYGSDSPASGVTAGTDCDDSETGVNPDAIDTTVDGVDNDCDGSDAAAVVWIIGTGVLQELDIATGTLSTLLTGLGQSLGIAFDGERTLYITEYDTGNVVWYDVIDGTSGTLFSAVLNGPNGVSWSSSDGQLLVASLGNSSVELLDTSTGTVSTQCSGVNEPAFVVEYISGTYAVSARTANRVQACDPSTGSLTDLFSLEAPNGVVYDGIDLCAVSRDYALVACRGAGTAFTDLTRPGGICENPNGGLVVLDSGATTIYGFDPYSGVVTPSTADWAVSSGSSIYDCNGNKPR